MRTSNGSSTDGSTTAGPILFACPLTVNSSKIATSIKFTKPSSGGICGIYAVSGVISGDVPKAPTAINSTNISETSFQANWNSVTGANSYVIDVATSSNFTSGNILSSYNVGNATSYNVNISTQIQATPSQKFYYRVRAVNSYGQSASSNTIDLTYIKILAGTESKVYTGAAQTSATLQQTSYTLSDGNTYTVSNANPEVAASGTVAGTYKGSAANTTNALLTKGSTTITDNKYIYTDTSVVATLNITKIDAKIEDFSITNLQSKTYDGLFLNKPIVNQTGPGYTSWS